VYVGRICDENRGLRVGSWRAGSIHGWGTLTASVIEGGGALTVGSDGVSRGKGAAEASPTEGAVDGMTWDGCFRQPPA
jgi:hypothetical protein